MAKKSVLARNRRRQRLVARYAERRAQYKAASVNMKLSEEERETARRALHRLPRDSNPVRLRNRCAFHGRGKGVYARFGMCRNKLRELAMDGGVPGLTKASW